MSQLNGINQGSHISHNIVQTPASPAAPQGVHPSGAAIAGRVVAGILTLGLSEVIRAVIRHVSADANAPAPRVQTPGIPTARPEEDLQNSVLAGRIRSGETLPPACQAALQEGIDDLREAFGEDIIPQGTAFTSMPRYYTLRAGLARAISDASDAVTPQQLRDMLKTLAAPLMAEQVLQKAVADVAQAAGYERDPDNLRLSVQNAVPGLDTAVKAATNRQEAEAAIAPFTTAIEARVTLEKDILGLEAREEERAITLLAEGTGLSKDTILTKFDRKNLRDKLAYCGQDFFSGANKATGEERANAFRAVTDTFVQNKLALWASVDSLPLSPQQADFWKGRALSARELTKPNMLTDFHQAGSQVDATPLLTLLNDPAITAEEIVGYMQSLALRVEDKLQSHYGAQAWADLGADGQTMARDFAARAMVDRVPGLAAALSARKDEFETILSTQADIASDTLSSLEASRTEEEQASITLQAATAARMQLLTDTLPAAEHNALLASNLGTSEMSLPHLQALEQSIVEARIYFGEDCLPAGNALQALNAHDPVTRTTARHGLEKAIRESPAAIASEDMARLTAEAIHNAAVRGACISLLRQTAQEQGLDVDDDSVRAVMESLTRRYPNLLQNLGEAENRADLQAQLASLPEVDALLRAEGDTQTRGLPTRLQEAVNTAREILGVVPLDEIIASMQLSGEDSILVRAELERLQGAAPEQPARIQEHVGRALDRFAETSLPLDSIISGLGLPREEERLVRADIIQNFVDNARSMLAAGVPLDEVMLDFMDRLSTDDAARMRVELSPRPAPGEGANTSIRNDADLLAFIKNMAFGQPGSSVVLGETSASDGTPATLYQYNGLVFRSDGRDLSAIREQGGMRQRESEAHQGLTQEEILQEAQGLAFHKGAGATGQSGISMSKHLDGCVAYYASGGGIYIIDSRQLGDGQNAYDLQAIMNSAGHADVDTGGEVNATDVPLGAIVGCISLPEGPFIDVSDTADNELKIGKLLNYITQHPEYVTRNPGYTPLAGGQA